MRSLISWLLCVPCAFLCSGATLTFHVSGDDPGGWPHSLLDRLAERDGKGRRRSDPGQRRGNRNRLDPARRARHDSDPRRRLASGCFVRLPRHAPSPHLGPQRRGSCARPKLRIIWEKAARLAGVRNCRRKRASSPASGTKKRALVAGFRRGAGRGPVGRRAAGPARLRALPLHSAGARRSGPRRLPSAPRACGRSSIPPTAPASISIISRARWRQAGIGALHVAAWHYWERDPQADEYLRKLIDACHRNGIPVYAWFELPHVSETILGPASGVARENRPAAGRPARLAQAHEPDQSRGLRGSLGGRRAICAAASIGMA